MPKPLHLYALAAAAGLLAFLYFHLRSKRLAARPSEGSAFRKYGEDIRLRDIFRLAALIEQEGRTLYLNMAAKAAKPETRKLCEELAEEETAHLRLIQAQLGSWRPLAPNFLLWPAFLEKVKQDNLFGGAPGPEAAEDTMAAFAIRQEFKTAEFYRSFEEAFPEAWKRAQLHELVLEELGHETQLRAAYPHLI